MKVSHGSAEQKGGDQLGDPEEGEPPNLGI